MLRPLQCGWLLLTYTSKCRSLSLQCLSLNYGPAKSFAVFWKYLSKKIRQVSRLWFYGCRFVRATNNWSMQLRFYKLLNRWNPIVTLEESLDQCGTSVKTIQVIIIKPPTWRTFGRNRPARNSWLKFLYRWMAVRFHRVEANRLLCTQQQSERTCAAMGKRCTSL